MTKESKKRPELRFPEFTDDWEQCKLGDISEIKTGPFGSMLHADDYVSNGVPIITTEHFKTGTLPTDKCGLPQVSENDFNRLSAYILNEGDIVFSRVGSVDINALITPLQSNWLFSGRVLRVRPQDKNSSQFLHTLLETENIKSDIRARAVGQAMPSINTEILKTTQLLLPVSIAEQELLGEYFHNLDNLIALRQRELDELKELKKGMLQKMFPKNGEKVPEIRFPEFTGDWEQHKVKEFAVESEVKGHSGKDAKKLTVKLHNKGVYVADEKIQGSDNTQYYIRRAGQFIYGKQNFFNGAIGIVPEKLDKYESTKDVPAFDISSDVNVNWLYYYIARPEIYKPQEALCTGTGSKRFHANNFYNLSLAIPKMDEQIKIKGYFVHLDNLIALHLRELDGYKELKKGLLQQMFC